MNETDGPFLQAALICDRCLQEADGTISAIRIVDRLTRTVGNPESDTFEQFQHPLAILISFRAGAARGRFKVGLRIEKPSGEQNQLADFPVHFESDDRGANLVINTIFEPDQEGLYWFDVLFQEKRVTRMPLRVMYQPLQMPGQ